MFSKILFDFKSTIIVVKYAPVFHYQYPYYQPTITIDYIDYKLPNRFCVYVKQYKYGNGH